MEQNKRIPESTISRLNVYLRELIALAEMKIKRISSAELGERTNLSDAQIRKDLNYFGSFGKSGVGYDVKELISSLKRILGRNETWNIAVIGAGSLGSALMKYPGFKKQSLNLCAAFDIDPKKINKEINKIPIYGLDKLARVIRDKKISICVIAVPQTKGREIADKVVKTGIKCILNFTPVSLNVPEDVVVRNVDLSGELEILTYFLVR